jgi:heptosyltransferase-2
VSNPAVLIIGPSWVGDMVMAQSLFKVLKQQQADTRIDVLAPAWSLPILERMPEVNRGIVMPLGHGQLQLAERYRLGKSLRDQYRQAILLPNSLKSALVPAFAGINKRTGWKGEVRYGLLNDMRHLDKQHYPLMVQRFVALALPKNAPLPDPCPAPALQSSPEQQQAVAQKYRLDAKKPLLVFCPGAEFGPAKQWPAEYFAEVARQQIEKSWQVVIVGSANDAGVAEGILGYLDDTEKSSCRNLAGDTELVEVVDLLAQAGAVVTNDSGLMHIAAAVDTPLVAIYGSTSPAFTPPLSDNARIISSDLECAPCFERTCPLGHGNCLKQTTPRQVLEKLSTIECQ